MQRQTINSMIWVLNYFLPNGCPIAGHSEKALRRARTIFRESWKDLLEQLARTTGSHHDFSVIGGFIEEVAAQDYTLSKELLDECAAHSELRTVLVALHPSNSFTEADLDRCMALLDNQEVGTWMFGPILWRDNYAHLPSERLLELAQKLLSKANGDETLLEALSMKLHGKNSTEDVLGLEFRKLGLKAGSCRECCGNFLAAISGHVIFRFLRRRGQEAWVRGAETRFPSHRPCASGSGRRRAAPRAAWARSLRRAARSGS